MNTLNLSTSVFGAAVGAVATFILYIGLGLSAAAIGIIAGVVVVLYIVASVTSASGSGPEPGPSGFARGLLIGANTMLNGTLALAIWGALFGDTVGAIMAAVIGIINFLSVFPPVSQAGIYQGFLGWSNWLMPSSWVVVGLGLLFLVLSVLGHLIGLIAGSDFLKLSGARVDGKTGTFFFKGGFVSNLNFRKTAFNMGNFAFVHKDAGDWHLDHEAGHSLNLGAFGSVSHFVGAIDENVPVIGGRGRNAYAERIAESNVPSTGQSNIIPMWT